MDRNDLKKLVIKCVMNGAEQRHDPSGQSYCTMYGPSNVREPYYCPLLEQHLVYVLKGSGLFVTAIPYWVCHRDQLRSKEKLDLAKIISQSIDYED